MPVLCASISAGPGDLTFGFGVYWLVGVSSGSSGLEVRQGIEVNTPAPNC